MHFLELFRAERVNLPSQLLPTLKRFGGPGVARSVSDGGFAKDRPVHDEPAAVMLLLGRPRRCAARNASPSDVDRRGALRRPSAQVIKSPQRYSARGPNRR
jgi:hypothetical protein